MSIWKWVPMQNCKVLIKYQKVLITTCITYLQILVKKSFNKFKIQF